MSLRSLCTAVLLVSAAAAAQARPDEEAMFGGDPSPAPAADAGMAESGHDEGAMFGATPPPAPSSSAAPVAPLSVKAGVEEDARAAAVLSGPATVNKFDTQEVLEDPLKIGGQFYWRYQVDSAERTPPSKWSVSAPTLLDAYLDARPNDRLRGFARARLQYDPTLEPGSRSSFAPATTVAAPAQNPGFLLDQLWLNFDVARTLFVTAGRQHVRWSVSRFWTPVDFLPPEARDPLAIFDARAGANLLKLHLPWEAKSWNFYAYGLLDNYGPGNRLGRLGGALRAELLFGNTEVALVGVFQNGRLPRYGLEISSALGPIDVYTDVALRPHTDAPVWRLRPGVTTSSFVDGFVAGLQGGPTPFELYRPAGPLVQATAGLTWTIPYADNDNLTVGAEYFFNQAGYSDPVLFPVNVFYGTYKPFYAGQHYAGAYVAAMGPGRFNDTTLSVSTLGNLSDRTFLSRFDCLYQVLTYLQLGVSVAYHYGGQGEFHFGLDLPAQSTVPATVTDPTLARLRDEGMKLSAPLLDFGLGAIISI